MVNYSKGGIKMKTKAKAVFLIVLIAMLTLLMTSQTYAQIGSNFTVNVTMNDGCTYQGPAKLIEDYNGELLFSGSGFELFFYVFLGLPPSFAISMDLISTSGPTADCVPVIFNANNTMRVASGNPALGFLTPPGVRECRMNTIDGSFGSVDPRDCWLIVPYPPNFSENVTNFIEIWGQIAPDYSSLVNGQLWADYGGEGSFTARRTGDAILFPWIVQSDDVTTVVSVVNTAQTWAESAGLPFHDNRIHIEYWHKKTTANGQEEKCTEYNFEVTSSKDDMVTWDIGGHFNGGLPMFNDESNEVIGVPDMSLAVEKPRRGFLIVDNATEALLDARTPVDGTIYGEATIIEHRTGAAWGYVAYNSIFGLPYFYNSADQNGEVIGRLLREQPPPEAMQELYEYNKGEVTQTTLLNPNDATTKLFVTPVGLTQNQGNINARVQLCRFPEINAPQYDAVRGSHYPGECTGGGIWNNEEGGFSFTVKKNVVCTTADNIAELFGGAGTSAYTQWVASGKAGWSYITTDFGNIDDRDGTEAYEETSDAIIGKLEYGTGLSWDGSIDDTINTFVWLRDSSTYQHVCASPLPAYGIPFIPQLFEIAPYIDDLRCRPGGINNIHNVAYQQIEETGACCIPLADTCTDYMTLDNCENLPGGLGEWQGEGTECSTVTCPDPPPTGACCMPDDSCIVQTEYYCTEVGGQEWYEGVPCNPC